MIYEIKIKVNEAFGDKVICVGYPFEVDNQLASLCNKI